MLCKFLFILYERQFRLLSYFPFSLSWNTMSGMYSCRMMHRSSGRNNFDLARDDNTKSTAKSSPPSKLSDEQAKQIGEQTNTAITAAQASDKGDNKS